MNILVSNDDGIFALGIRTLANTLAAAGHAVTVVCPDRERSATGHGLTLHDPIRAEPVPHQFDPPVRAWACSGTPADCVKLALGALLDHPPDFVLSGINHGPNLGTDTLYSGTVSAAMEGLLENIPSIALSLAKFESRDFEPAARFAVQLVARLVAHPPTGPMLLNVNIPAVPEAEIRGVRLTQLGHRRYIDQFAQRTDPQGRTYYWLSGEVVEDSDPDLGPRPGAPQVSTDVRAIRENYIAIAPMHFNLSDLDQIPHWQDYFAAHWVEESSGGPLAAGEGIG